MERKTQIECMKSLRNELTPFEEASPVLCSGDHTQLPVLVFRCVHQVEIEREREKGESQRFGCRRDPGTALANRAEMALNNQLFRARADSKK